MMQRKVKCRYVGESKFKPENVPAEKWMPVIAFEVVRGSNFHEGKEKTFENLFYHVIDSKGKLVKVASFNCQTIIDDNAEVQGGTLSQMVNNLTVMVKVLGEKICATSSNASSKESENKSGEVAPSAT